MKCTILAAGEGSRLQEITPFKPLTPLWGKPLLEHTNGMLKSADPDEVIIIFNDSERQMDFDLLPSLAEDNVQYFFKTTESSMHSLYEVMQRADLDHGQHIIVTMMDSIIREADFHDFIGFCRDLPDDQSAVIVTSYIEDEKPLTVSLTDDNVINEFQIPVQDADWITSGIYCFSQSAYTILRQSVADGDMKMRNFLKRLVEENQTVHGFKVEKTLDVDRPEDIKSAEDFLSGIGHE